MDSDSNAKANFSTSYVAGGCSECSDGAACKCTQLYSGLQRDRSADDCARGQGREPAFAVELPVLR